ncbi:trans-2,3-dihydro-3-hydroxyanthranilate isomerase [Fistulifera solaris]|uniref:Trans-2,3-dihydro-3-hydroxyanthranilate isomerase n=1 Tax=Fistulifera solaris TaxID=1519565 RepID=A0A1Z5JRF4_FISSO|nr:trans-2,3-dihydro-3-hydroxyanthranilate isomerase [Fistulifera solaris]|eukprot:GAX16610.1 trans-2,3-dihydro-3-hydroxyanthranilate isomerase [Fistulifera solaris]
MKPLNGELMIATAATESIAAEPSSPTTLLDRILFREVRPTDIPICFEIESNSYPDDEQASKSTLQYRQHHAAPYFRCAVLYPTLESKEQHKDEEEDHEDAILIGFVCSTRCRGLSAESFTTHVPWGPQLALHSVAVHPEYRNQGVATALLQDYLKSVTALNSTLPFPMEQIILLAKSHLLEFYIRAGFAVKRPSPIVHGKDLWYECEYTLPTILCFHVNAFGTGSTLGNPAGVVILPAVDRAGSNIIEETFLAKQEWMQKVAAQFNLSETAFILPLNDASATFGIRYFTPTMEVELCGHATLASAAVLYQNNICMSETPIVFETKTRTFLTCNWINMSNSRMTSIAMEFPIQPATELGSDEDKDAVKNMVMAAAQIPTEGILFMGLSRELGDVLIELTPEAFASLDTVEIDFSAFLRWGGYSRGVIVCCRTTSNEEGIDFLSRFFAPKAGIDEDPVTGSAHCVLAPHFWKETKEKLVGKQASKRGGVVECQLIENERVRLTGWAVTVMQGSLYVT